MRVENQVAFDQFAREDIELADLVAQDYLISIPRSHRFVVKVLVRLHWNNFQQIVLGSNSFAPNRPALLVLVPEKRLLTSLRTCCDLDDSLLCLL